MAETASALGGSAVVTSTPAGSVVSVVLPLTDKAGAQR
jgi:signal transduction histidine kinase